MKITQVTLKNLQCSSAELLVVQMGELVYCKQFTVHSKVQCTVYNTWYTVLPQQYSADGAPTRSQETESFI